MTYFDQMKSNWKIYFSTKKNRLFLGSIIIFLSVILLFFTNFLQVIESRNGFSFRDPILSLFDPIDLTWIIFGMIYGGLVLALFSLLKSPQVFTLAILTYAIMVVFRILAMYSLPLNPPETMIALKDPFVEFFGGGKILTKDLFFSGHTATSFIFFLTALNKKIRIAFLLLTIIMGFSVLLMHVHYAVDVLIAPFVAFTSFYISKKIHNKFDKID